MIKKLLSKIFGETKKQKVAKALDFGHYTRDTEWGTYDNRWIKIRDLDDAHLANIIKHLYTYKFNDQLMHFMILECVLRGLTIDFIDRAQIPFKDKDGNWMLWSDTEHRPVKVG